MDIEKIETAAFFLSLKAFRLAIYAIVGRHFFFPVFISQVISKLTASTGVIEAAAIAGLLQLINTVINTNIILIIYITGLTVVLIVNGKPQVP